MARYVRICGCAIGGLVLAALMLGAAPARAEQHELRIGIQFGLVYLPVAVADDQGYFVAEAGKLGLDDLKVTIQRFSGSPAINEALISDSVDVGAYGVPGLLIAWDKTRLRQDVVGLAGLAAHSFVLETNKPEIKRFTDFGEQDRIAVPASTSTQAILMRMAAEKFYGSGQYARIDKLLVSMPHPDATTALLAGRSITGYVATPPFIATLARSPKIHAVLTSKQILGEEATGAALGAGRKFVETNPNLVQAIIAALEDAKGFIEKTPSAAADIYIKSESSKLPKDEILAMLQDGSIVYNTTPTGIKAFADFMAKTGELKTDPDSWKDVFVPLLRDREGS